MRDALLLAFFFAAVVAVNEVTWRVWGRYRAAEVRRLEAANAALVVEIEGLRTGGRP